MSLLLRPRESGRHRADSLTETPALPRRSRLTAPFVRHARRPRPQIVREFTGWSGLARLCEEAARNPVVDPRIAFPARFRADADHTQPFTFNLKDFQ
ncbi:hypothetical protein Sme01_04000 [Sphaerisporangium melleum]|uniref:Uncharacterized protein n=1 Tax=Sphaerisporangium melleum TaxID=321316 RepID=A0A917QQH4_9ACTN|nr:hypothetical protein [Sphaerisporangium melleum]GGK62080.1 hypothetical protein GCM10007964_01550 [Sphaerisporangium melleum]GII67924.1 hypothetical protein Sme01_04000 [Sphaerisporangium melleum]